MDQRQAVGIAVLQVLQGFVEHHAGHAAVAVNQVNFDSGCSSSVLAAIDRMGVMPEPAAKPTRCRARGFFHEAAFRRHHVEAGAGLQGLRRPVGEQAALDRADADFQLAGPGQAAFGLLIE